MCCGSMCCGVALRMALAVEHHLHIANHISFAQIAEMFFLFSSKYLITEFIPANDSKVQLLIKNRNKDLSAYTIEAYKIALEKYFNIIDRYLVCKIRVS